MSKKESCLNIKHDEDESQDNQDTLSKYIELNSKCDAILERIKKERKKKSSKG